MAEEIFVTIDFNPMVSPHREDPHLFYREARGRPVTMSPAMGAYMVTRYDDLVTVLDDPGTYSSSAALPRIYDNPPEVVAELERRGVAEAPAVVNGDGPGHAHQRGIYEASFTGARVRALLPMMREHANALVDAFPQDGADLVGDYAFPFVRSVIETVVGLPAQDSARVQDWTDQYMLLINPFVPVPDRVVAARHVGDYADYLQGLIEARRAEPRTDMISEFVHGANGRPPVTDAETQNIVRAARIAGFDTTRDAITATLLAILEDPAVGQRVLDDPSGAIPKVTEEAIRRDAPHRGLFRITTRDTELGGTALPAGSLIFLLFGSGNRDEQVFDDPDRFDPERDNMREHLAFGRGLHTCPAAPLARAEIRVALETLLRRLPGLRLAPGSAPEYYASYFFRGLESLRVTW